MGDRIAMALCILALTITLVSLWDVHRLNMETYQNIDATYRLLGK